MTMHPCMYPGKVHARDPDIYSTFPVRSRWIILYNNKYNTQYVTEPYITRVNFLPCDKALYYYVLNGYTIYVQYLSNSLITCHSQSTKNQQVQFTVYFRTRGKRIFCDGIYIADS